MKRLLDDVQAYVSHLSNAAVSPRKVVVFKPPELSNTRTSPHQPSHRATTVLSPRAIRSMAAEASATSLSPRIPPKRPKKIIQLSDHEESILELALFYEEAMKQMTGAQQKKKNMHFWTERWLLVPSRTKTKVLKSVKAKLSRGSFFSNAVGRESTPQRSQSSSSTVRLPDRSQLKHDTLFSIVVLCLQESIRSVSVLSSDAANSAWQVLCEDTLKRVEGTLDLVMEQRGKLQDQLEEMKNSRASVET
ncbi:hypothetical protein Poli38472_005925 [Pythium oligandrum]|uniref:Uncharacterized protein n=1 Tax=Pythium oligandrum TaxID=41045 RepID=A0A8K1CTG0_PYTOL|nr:hypothetical protein Poli38472_005925 [Pythium oligandrum]|eukprot:TMW68457.1 hypothetical protein Poli38472_005925 [Pythium oligandrum]